jgi:hypothetical protein
MVLCYALTLARCRTRRSSGKSQAHTATTVSVAQPPASTAASAPTRAAFRFSSPEVRQAARGLLQS